MLEPYRAQTVNFIVVSMAATAMRDRCGTEGVLRILKRFQVVYSPQQGVGSELEKIIYRWLGLFLPESTSDCECEGVKDTMNRYGSAYCRQHIGSFVDKLEANHKLLGVRIVFVRKIAEAAIKSACKRAEQLVVDQPVLPPPLLDAGAIRKPSSADRIAKSL
tara:strand:+ start:3655 stop:4140 length:486 start_codon:yes stop_codon:yes gene_type:complete